MWALSLWNRLGFLENCSVIETYLVVAGVWITELSGAISG
jgi:hypothetical protein